MSSSTPVGGARQQFRSIPGFSDRTELPRLGKLRLGVKAQKGTATEHPTETDHFVLDLSAAVPAKDAEAIVALFTSLYGATPQVIRNVRLVSNDVESTFSSAYEWWRAGKLACHGNGIEALRKIEGEWVDWTADHPCANAGCPDFGKKKCGLISRLRVMIPDVSVSGFFQVDTGSVYSSMNILNGINMAASLTAQALGEQRLMTMPFTLLRAPQPIEFEGRLNTHYIIHLQPMNLTMAGMEQRLSAAPQMLTAGTPLIPDEADDLPEELVPTSEHGGDVAAEVMDAEEVKEPQRTSAAPPAKPQAAGIYVTGAREAKKGPGYTLWKIRLSTGAELATFKDFVFNTAVAAAEGGKPVSYETKDTAKGTEIVSMEILK